MSLTLATCLLHVFDCVSGIELRRFVSVGVSHVFLSCDRPTVVSSANGRLLFSNVNVSSVSHMAPFHAPVFKDCLALVSSTQLMIGHIDDIQKLHIKKVRTGGQPRRLAHHSTSATLAVIVMEPAPIDTPNDLTGEITKIKLFDAKEYACMHELTLKTNETALAIASVNLNPHANAANSAVAGSDAVTATPAVAVYPEYLLVGTAFMNPEEPEPSAGRLLVLAVDSSSGRPSLRVVCEASVRGGVFSVACIQGRIVAGVNASVVVYRCVSTGVLGAAVSSSSSAASSGALIEGACRIEKECDYTGNVLVLHLSVSHDHQYILVGDMMKGVCMLHYSSSLSGSGVQSAHGASSLSEVARDYEAHWLTAMSSFSDRDDICIFADHYFNLVTLRRQTDAASEEERGRMECVGRWHAGEMINKIARGSLVMQLPDDAEAQSGAAVGAFDRVVPTHVYGSINGAVGVLAPLSLTAYKFFARLEEELEKVSTHRRGCTHLGIDSVTALFSPTAAALALFWHRCLCFRSFAALAICPTANGARSTTTNARWNRKDSSVG